jgi:hypothetical protein
MNNGPFRDDGFQHYYLRGTNNAPYGVVVIAPGSTPATVHRGISLCAAMDQWDRVAGRGKAVGRVKKAMGCKASSEPVANDMAESVDTFIALHAEQLTDDTMSVFKAAYDTPATEKEKAIIENLLKKQAAAS